MRPFFVFLLLNCVSYSLSYCQNNQLPQAIDQLVQEYHQVEEFNGVALVSKNGKIIYQKAFGLADQEWRTPHSLDGKFVIGSLSKQFTASLALLFHQEGILDLDKPIIHYLPDFPNKAIGEQINSRHLLTCTSGLPHYNAWEDFMENNDRLFYDQEKMLDMFSEIELLSNPGSQYQYSSLGYLIMGYILEAIGKKPLAELFQEYIFQKVGMDNTSLDNNHTILAKRVKGYRFNYKRAIYDNANYRDASTSFSAGGIITTAEDLLKWDQVLSQKKLIQQETYDLLTSPIQSNYAYGWRTVLPRRTDTLNLHWHAGQITGFTSMMLRVPDDGYCIILLSNNRGMPGTEIANQILNILYEQEVTLPRRSLLKTLLKTIVYEDVAAAITQYENLKSQSIDQYTFGQTELLILGIELNSEGMYEEAIQMLELNIKEYPDSPYLFYNWLYIGNSYRSLGQNDKAIKSYESVLEINPNIEQAQNALAELEK
ncbi:MAG: serine hydrolase [Bacteroidota bacterium]